MTTYDPHDQSAGDELPSDVLDLLSSAAVWADVDLSLEDSIVAAVMHEADSAVLGDDLSDQDLSDQDFGSGHVAEPVPSSPPQPPVASGANVIDIGRASRWRWALAGAAAAAVALIAGFGVVRALGDDVDLQLALAGTDLAPQASAIADITETAEGTRIVIEVQDLPPAEPGTYYQAWLRIDGEIGVSAGTFHLREGNAPIELWAGVTADEYPLLTVTLQQEAQTESSGQVVLKGRIGG